jgi:hypothetical protein
MERADFFKRAKSCTWYLPWVRGKGLGKMPITNKWADVVKALLVRSGHVAVKQLLAVFRQVLLSMGNHLGEPGLK